MKNIFSAFIGVAMVMAAYTTSAQQAPVIEWARCYGGSGAEWANSIQQTTDEGFIIAGYSWSIDGDATVNHGGEDFWIVKINDAGDIQWQKSYGGSYEDVAYSVQQTIDGGNIVAGDSYSNDGNVSGNNGDFDYWVAKLDSDGNIDWQKSLGGDTAEVAFSILQASDSGYIIAGLSISNDSDVVGNHGSGDCWVVKLDADGNLDWQKCLGGSLDDEGVSIQGTTDGGYIVAVNSESNDGDVSQNYGESDYWIVKLDMNGNVEWQKSFGGSSADQVYSIKQIVGGGFIVAGGSFSNDGDVSGNHGTWDYWILKLDSAGSLIWQKCLGGTNSERANSIAQTTDEGFIIAGYSRSSDDDVSINQGYEDYWVVRLDSDGNLIWQESLGGIKSDVAYSIQQTTDGGYIVAGYTFSNDGDVSGNHSASYDFWVVKLSPELPTAIPSSPTTISLSLTPNPAHDLLTINSSSPNTNSNITVYDVAGRKFFPSTTILNNSVQVNTSALPDGIYTLQVINNLSSESRVGRFVKQ